MKHFSLPFIVCLISLAGYSQGEIILRGKIITSDDDAGFIHVINITQKTGTTSGTTGNFEIRVNANDTLLFSAVQYERQEIIISEEIYRDKFMAVVMKEAVNQMDEMK